MEFYRYVNVFKKRLPLILLLAVVGMGAAYGFSRRQPKIYKATATLLINTAQPASIIPYLDNALNGNSGIPPLLQLANTYGVFLKSRSFDTTVIQSLRLTNVSSEQLSTQVSSALIPDTNYLQISVQWNSSKKAADIATGIAKIFIRENAAQQAATEGTGADAQISQSLNYFRHQIVILQRRYSALVSNPRSDPAQVNAVADRLTNINDTYYKLLGTASATIQSTGLNSAALSDPATPPHFPILPHVTTNTLLGLLTGLLLGLVLAFLLDFLDYSTHTPEDVEQLVGQAPLGIVGVIGVDSPSGVRKLFRGRLARKPSPPPALAAPNGHGNGHGKAGVAQVETLAPLTVLDKQLVTLNFPKAPITEAFRTLRTNLDFSSLDRSLKTLVITSSVPAEGKSTISANLAIAEAQAGKRVILVDADLRRPAQAKLFGIKPATGLTTVLLNREDRARAIDEALQPTMVANLQVMTSGPHPPNPAELLASQSATDLIQELAARADLVIFDTPPMGPLTDAIVLSARVDGTMIVVRANSTRRTVITNSINTIKKVGGNVVGTVLNMVDVKGISAYSYYYYYRTDYYYDRDEATAAKRAHS